MSSMLSYMCWGNLSHLYLFGHTKLTKRCSIDSFSIVQKLSFCLTPGQCLEAVTLGLASGFNFGRGLLDLNGNKEKVQVILSSGKSYISKLNSRDQTHSCQRFYLKECAFMIMTYGSLNNMMDLLYFRIIGSCHMILIKM